MAFSEETKRKVWEAQGGRCGNPNCRKQLVWNNRGVNGGRGAWEAHHKKPVSQGGSDRSSNCLILCYDCHQRPQRLVANNSRRKTPSFGNIDDLLWGNRR